MRAPSILLSTLSIPPPRPRAERLSHAACPWPAACPWIAYAADGPLFTLRYTRRAPNGGVGGPPARTALRLPRSLAAGPLLTAPPRPRALRWVNGTWDFKYFKKADGETDWDAVLDVEIARRELLERSPISVPSGEADIVNFGENYALWDFLRDFFARSVFASPALASRRG